MSREDHNQTSDEGAGDTIFVFRTDLLGEPDTSATAEAGIWEVQGSPEGSGVLVVKRGPNAGSQFLLDQPVTSAGRHPGSDIFLDEITVSRRHAQFRLEHDQVRILDVGSLNGTFVNREPVDSAVLVNGDEIQIGKFRLIFLTSRSTD